MGVRDFDLKIGREGASSQPGLGMRRTGSAEVLNNAKFKVLNEMAPLVIFGDAERDKRVSYCPFEREWNWLKDAGAAQQARSINVIALRSTNIEYIIPRAFRAFFILVGLAVAIEVTRKLLVLP